MGISRLVIMGFALIGFALVAGTLAITMATFLNPMGTLPFFVLALGAGVGGLAVALVGAARSGE
ncbi:MAG: hypothetical protein ACYDCK_09160 [Thermoplasmatota archaeon]